jgi:hypothetical protein
MRYRAEVCDRRVFLGEGGVFTSVVGGTEIGGVKIRPSPPESFQALPDTDKVPRATCIEDCMALKLYRRHRTECEGAHPEDARTGEFEEGRRGWKKCGCLIHASGTLGGKFNRRQTGRADWDEAKALACPVGKAGAWDGQDAIEAPVSLPSAKFRARAYHCRPRDNGLHGGV